MKIVIIKDEKLTADDLAVTITKFLPDVKILSILSSVKDSIAFFRGLKEEADLIFSDIQLGDGTSFEIFSQVDILAPVIFCTAFDEYALDAFKANGIDYILKPFTDDMIHAALKKYQSLKKRMAAPQASSFDKMLKLFTTKKSEGQGAILVYHKDKILPVALVDIAFFYFKNGASHLSMFDKKSYYLNKSLDDLEKIAGTNFFRVNRQYLVNRKAVADVSNSLSRKLSVSLTAPTEETVLVSKEKMPQFLHWLTKRYLLGGVIVLIIGAIMLPAKGFVGAAFIPDADQGQLLIKLELQTGVSIYQTNVATQQAEKLIMAHPEVVNVFSSVGFVTGSIAGSNSNNNQAEMTVTLVDKNKRKFSSQEFGLTLQKEITNAIPGAKITSAATSIAGGGNAAPIQISVQGVALKDVRSTAESVQKIVTSVPGAQGVELSVKDPKPEIELKLDREKMTLLGVNAAQVGTALQNAFNGNDDNKFRQNGNEYTILIRLDAANRSNIDDVKNLTFQNNNGLKFTLSQFEDVYQGTGESVLQRNNRLSSITINANVVGRPVGSVVTDIQKKWPV